MRFPAITQAIVVLTAVVSLFQNNFQPFDAILHIAATISFLWILSCYSIASNIGKYFVLFGLWMSVVFIPAFHLGAQFSLGARDVTQYDNDLCVAFGSKIFIIACISWILSFKESSTHISNTSFPKPISAQSVRFLMVVMFVLTSICYILGVGRMGSAEVVLPFHLTGIINLSRKVLFPALFAIIIENYILRNQKIPRSFFAIYFIWCIFEMITWLSKSILIMNILPVGIILIIYYRPSTRTILRYAMPMLLLFLVLYPIIAAMRNADKGKSFSEYVVNAINLADEENEDAGTNSPIIAPINRAFMTYNLYTKDYCYISGGSFIDFSRVPTLIAVGGAAGYQTYVLDGYPLEAHHSSGTSGLMDPLLHGGYGFCYAMVIVLMLIGGAIDRFSRKHFHNITIQLMLILYSFVLIKNISALYDGVGVSTIVAQIASMYLAYKYNYQNRLN